MWQALAGAVPVETVERVLTLYREKVFRSKRAALSREAGAGTWDQTELHLGEEGRCREPDWWARSRQRGVHLKRRERRPLPGMLLHIDGSRHRWFQDERWYDLLVILDDAKVRSTTRNWWRRNRR